MRSDLNCNTDIFQNEERERESENSAHGEIIYRGNRWRKCSDVEWNEKHIIPQNCMSECTWISSEVQVDEEREGESANGKNKQNYVYVIFTACYNSRPGSFY